MIKRSLLSALIFTLSLSFALAQPQSYESNTDNLLPLNANVTYGKLENGLTYYIQKNKEPENRAELRLVVKAGSILETDRQQCLAHFVEHMAFNGTKN